MANLTLADVLKIACDGNTMPLVDHENHCEDVEKIAALQAVPAEINDALFAACILSRAAKLGTDWLMMGLPHITEANKQDVIYYCLAKALESQPDYAIIWLTTACQELQLMRADIPPVFIGKLSEAVAVEQQSPSKRYNHDWVKMGTEVLVKIFR